MTQQKNSGLFDAYADVSRLPEEIDAKDLAKSVADLPGLRFVILQTISKRLKLLFDTRKNRDSACQKTFSLLKGGSYEFRLLNGQPPWVYRMVSVQGWPLNAPLNRLGELLQQFGELVEGPVWSTWPETSIPDGKVLIKLKCSRDRTIPTVVEHRLDLQETPVKLRFSYRGQPIQCFICMEFGHLGKQCPTNSLSKEPAVGPIFENSVAIAPPRAASMPLVDTSQTAAETAEHESDASQREEMNSTSDFWSNESTTSPGQTPPQASAFEEHNANSLPPQISDTEERMCPEIVPTNVASCKPEPRFETCDINDVIRENQVNFRPPELNKDHFGKRLPISAGRRSSMPVKGETVRVQIRHISVGDVRDRMCADCYMVELRRLQSGQKTVPAEYWICCHGWNCDPELCNCDKSREAVWDHHWLFCTCKEPTEYRCCHGTDPPCWACLAVDGTFHEADLIE